MQDGFEWRMPQGFFNFQGSLFIVSGSKSSSLELDEIKKQCHEEEGKYNPFKELNNPFSQFLLFMVRRRWCIVLQLSSAVINYIV